MTSTEKQDADEIYDVAILGSGIGGAMLSSILARHGVRVVMLDSASHPRFAVGESLIPSTASRIRAIAMRYDVPQLAHISNFQRVSRHISSACGVKKNFGFVYHRPGRSCRLNESTQLCSIAPPAGPDSHLFRQDIDSYLVALAVSYGVDVYQDTEVREIEFDDESVSLVTAQGATYHAQYVVDASGHRSLLARQLELRESPCAFATHSRSIFTHMVGVRSWDECGSSAVDHGLVSPLCQGTLHHVFDGGWLWVIPFNNHARATNPLCSVGLNLDPRIHPRTADDPAAEFAQTVGRFPSIAAQFREARAVRRWIATDRLQYSSKRASGDRYCLLPHAAGFVDPLFSGGLQLTVSAIGILAGRLLQAFASGHVPSVTLAPYDVWLRRNLEHHDRMVECSYTAFSDFQLWNAWFRVYILGSFFETLSAIRAETRYYETQDKTALLALESPPHSGTLGRDVEPYMQLFQSAAASVDLVRDGILTPSEAASSIFQLLRNASFAPPQFKLAEASHRYASPYTALPSLRMVAWGKFRSPRFMREQFFDFRPLSYAPEYFRCLRESYSDSASRVRHTIRDMLFSWNKDWVRAK